MVLAYLMARSRSEPYRAARPVGAGGGVYGAALLPLRPVDLPAVEQVPDKTLHAAAYAVFGLPVLRATHGGIGPLRLRPALLALCWPAPTPRWTSGTSPSSPGACLSAWTGSDGRLGLARRCPWVERAGWRTPGPSSARGRLAALRRAISSPGPVPPVRARRRCALRPGRGPAWRRSPRRGPA